MSRQVRQYQLMLLFARLTGTVIFKQCGAVVTGNVDEPLTMLGPAEQLDALVEIRNKISRVLAI